MSVSMVSTLLLGAMPSWLSARPHIPPNSPVSQSLKTLVRSPQFYLLTVPHSTHAGIKRLYGERKFFGECKPVPLRRRRDPT